MPSKGGQGGRSQHADSFVELFVLVSLPAAASLINFVVLTSAASSANSGVFSTSRMLFGLAQDGQALSMFAKLSKRAVPAKGLTFSCMCLLGGVVMLMVNPSVIAAFTMITTVSAILFMFVWTITPVPYRYRMLSASACTVQI